MRKFICLSVVLALMLCAFAGCVQNAPTIGESTGGNVSADSTGGQQTTNTNGWTDTSYSTQPTAPVVVIPPTAPENPGNTLIPFDPDREIFLLYENQNVTIKKGYTSLPSIGVYIISKDALDVGTISLELSAQTFHTVSVGEIPLKGFPLSEDTELPESEAVAQRDEFGYTLYQCYMGKDFARLWELEQAYYALLYAHEEGEATAEKVAAAYEMYLSYRDVEKASYEQLTMEDLPGFHVYYASVMFFGGAFFSETITQAQLRIGDRMQTLELGQITIQLMETLCFPAELDWYNGGGYAYDGILGSGNGPLPYNGGLHRIDNYFSFTAEHFMSLTGVQLGEVNHHLAGVWIEIASASGGEIFEYWDMSEPYLVMPGDRVRIHIAYQDEGLSSPGYATKVWGYLIYEWDKGVSCKLSECDVRAKGWNYYELYAMVFEGLDMESYYRDYYYHKYEAWRKDIN